MDANAGGDAMKTRYSLRFILLLLTTFLGTTGAHSATTSTPTTDSTMQTHAAKINSKYIAQDSISAPSQGDIILLDGNNDPYPPCPGDPSNTPPTWPSVPICPDINGKDNPNLPTIFKVPTSSSYDALNNGKSRNVAYTERGLFCPDLCVTTRSAKPVAPTVPVTAPIQVTSFQIAACPAGYSEVTDFNAQPVIAYISIPQVVVGPFVDMTKFNAYNNNAAYFCSPGVQTPDPSGDLPFNNVRTGTNADGSYVYDQSITNAADGKSYYCSVNPVGPKIPAPDNGTDYSTDTYILTNLPNPMPNNASCPGTSCVGKWISVWTWTPYNNNPLSESDDSKWNTFQSFAPIGDNACWGSSGHIPNTFSTQFIGHKDIYWHYYRWERCRPVLQNGWFYVDSYEPVSHLCARVKPAWKTTNP